MKRTYLLVGVMLALGVALLNVNERYSGFINNYLSLASVSSCRTSPRLTPFVACSFQSCCRLKAENQQSNPSAAVL
jgi:hypothetical protein